MGFLYICNTGADYISKVDVEEFKENSKIILNKMERDKQGPHGVYSHKDKLYVANSYSNTLSIINKEENKVEESHFIGAHCNGVVVDGKTAYIICGELNNIVIFNLENKKTIEQIPCGTSPHSIEFDKEKKYIVISNMESNSITVIDCINRGDIKNIKVGNYPTKAIFTPDNKYILVSESNFESEHKGFLSVIATQGGQLVCRILVGKYPVDVCCRGTECIVSNFGEGSLSIIDLNKWQEIKKIYIGGMPRAVLWQENFIYAEDYYRNMLFKIDVLKENKKAISIGREPTGMTFG